MEDRKIEFPISLLFFWVKGFIAVTTSTVKVSMRNTILGVIPAGKNDVTLQVEKLQSANIHTSFKIVPILFGAILAFASFSVIKENFISFLILFIIAFCIFAGGFKQMLIIEREGKDLQVSVPFYAKNKLLDAQDAIIEAIEAHNKERNVLAGAQIQADATKAMADALVGAINNKQQ